jgi:hypothetical protein
MPPEQSAFAELLKRDKLQLWKVDRESGTAYN